MRNLGVAEDHELRWLFGNVPRLIPILIALYWCMICGLITHYVRTYAIWTNSYYIFTLYSQKCVSSPFHPHFEQQLTWHCFLRTIRHTWHRDCLPWSVMQRQPRWTEGKKSDSRVEKSYGKQKRWQQLLNFQIDYIFLNLSSMFIFLGWRIFEHIKWQIFNHGLFEALKVCSTAMMWGATGILTTHDPGKLIPIFLDRGREVKMVGDGNQWRFMIRFLWMRKLGVFVSKTFWCWSL